MTQAKEIALLKMLESAKKMKDVWCTLPYVDLRLEQALAELLRRVDVVEQHVRREQGRQP